MGKQMNLVCPRCREAFSRKEGTGEGLVALHCDKCGNELFTEQGKAKSQARSECACGGTYSADAPLLCPKCHAEIDRSTLNEAYMMEW